jgi:DNA adenine methylase
MLAPWIISHFPAHRTYVEPFGGAGSVLLQKPRSYSEVYNDLDGEIVNLFRVVRDNGAALVEKLKLTPFARQEFSISYESCENPLEQARRTVVRSFMGFGSASASGAKTGFRGNSSRSGTTPAHDWAHYPQVLREIIERLRGVVIENREAALIMEQHDSAETLHYVDPPYVISTRKIGNPYCKKGYRHEMTDEQHEQLAELLHGLQGMVIVSGYRCELYDRLYSTWRIHERIAHADGARRRVEVVWISPNTPVVNHELWEHRNGQ